MTDLNLTVIEITAATPAISCFRLARTDGAAMPGFTPGAHITIAVPGVGARKYSLVHVEPNTGEVIAPTTYVIAVRLEENGGGGSRFMHTLKIGDRLQVTPPQNNFPLKADTSPVALVAGGIGVTPLLTMAATLKGQNRPFSMAYAARSAGDLAFRSDLERLAGSALTLHLDDVAGGFFDVGAYLQALPPGTRVYTCGPKPMLKAGMDAIKKLGWPRDRLAFELFYSVAPAGDKVPAPAVAPVNDGSFEIVLKRSGKSFRVPPDKSILDVLSAAGIDPPHDCDRGECGICQVSVLEGIPDHKDSILTRGERASNKVMQICISRAISPRLVLDL